MGSTGVTENTNSMKVCIGGIPGGVPTLTTLTAHPAGMECPLGVKVLSFAPSTHHTLANTLRTKPTCRTRYGGLTTLNFWYSWCHTFTRNSFPTVATETRRARAKHCKISSVAFPHFSSETKVGKILGNTSFHW